MRRDDEERRWRDEGLKGEKCDANYFSFVFYLFFSFPSSLSLLVSPEDGGRPRLCRKDRKGARRPTRELGMACAREIGGWCVLWKACLGRYISPFFFFPLAIPLISLPPSHLLLFPVLVSSVLARSVKDLLKTLYGMASRYRIDMLSSRRCLSRPSSLLP